MNPRLDRPALLADCRRQLQELAGDVDATRRDAGFRAALETMAMFWRYSPFNTWVIQSKRPNATRVAGRRLWEKLGRTLNDGEEPIFIFAPTRAPYRFIAVPVFDQAQTHGADVPTLDLLHRGPADSYQLLEAAAARLGIVVYYDLRRPGVLGLSRGGVIEIAPNLPPRERVAVLAHELGHELLDHVDRRKHPDHSLRETEAEAVAFVVMTALGLPSRAATYIAWQGGTGIAVLASLERIQRAARMILLATAPAEG